MDEQTFFLCFEGSGVGVTAEARPKPGSRVGPVGRRGSGQQALSAAVPSGAAMLPHRALTFGGRDGVLRGRFRECHPLRHVRAMLVAQVAVGFHRQRTAVFVAEPAGNCWNVHARFDATGGKQVT